MILRQDVVEQVSLSHTGGVARSQIEEFLGVTAEATKDVIGDVPEAVREGMVFSELKVSVPVLKSVNRCDLRAETVETLLSLMEEEEFGSLLELEGGLADVGVVILKRRKLEELAKTEPVAACILRVGTLVSGADANARLEEEGGTAMEKVRESRMPQVEERSDEALRILRLFAFSACCLLDSSLSSSSLRIPRAEELSDIQ